MRKIKVLYVRCSTLEQKTDVEGIVNRISLGISLGGEDVFIKNAIIAIK
jgi:hypothetical protein